MRPTYTQISQSHSKRAATSYVFELEQHVPRQIYALPVHVFHSHQVPLEREAAIGGQWDERGREEGRPLSSLEEGPYKIWGSGCQIK